MTDKGSVLALSHLLADRERIPLRYPRKHQVGGDMTCKFRAVVSPNDGAADSKRLYRPAWHHTR